MHCVPIGQPAGLLWDIPLLQLVQPLIHIYPYELLPGIILVYLWQEAAPSTCTNPRTSSGVCQVDILHLWAPLIGVAVLMVLLVFLHNWVLVFHVVKSLRKKMNPQPFTRIGSRVVLGLLDTSHGDHSGGSSTLSKDSTLVSYVYP